MTQEKQPGEFDIIRSCFRPLAGPDALDLKDDTAWLSDEGLVVTKDLLVSDTHFLADDPPGDIARKALRVNISDVVCKGARPAHYFLGIVLPRDIDQSWLEAFAAGLKDDQAAYGISMAGGDTTRHAGEGPLTLSVTMTGRIADGRGPVLRSGAVAGDLLAVTGTIGDAGLGLAVRQDRLSLDPETDDFLRQRYRLPSPRADLAEAVSAFAGASLDISDGVLADAGHMAACSGVDITIDLEKLPLSDAAARWLSDQADEGAARGDLAAMGDDYEMLLAAPRQKMDELQKTAKAVGIELTVIGQCGAGRGNVQPFFKSQPVEALRRGYDHFE